MSEHITPNREALEAAISSHWTHTTCQLNLTERFETGSTLNYGSPVGGKTTLVYDLNIANVTSPTILENPSSWLWFDNAIVGGVKCRVAYLYLLSIKPEWRGKGIGKAYICTKASVLPDYGVSIIYLDAGHEGPRFWSKHGFQFIDQDKFWAHYAEYCEYNELQACEEMDLVVEEYFQYLRDSVLSYPMYRRL